MGWGCLVITIAIAGGWCLNHSGLVGLLMRASLKLVDTELVQISCLIAILLIVFPGYVMKRYFDGIAWDMHLKSIPPPDVRESAKRSKYVKIDGTPPAELKPVQVSDLPKEQKEFIATCTACGHLFPATRDSKDLRCPNCGESIPSTT